MCFNISALIVDELSILVVPSGPVIGPQNGGVVVDDDRTAFGRQNGLWIFRSLRKEIRLGFVWIERGGRHTARSMCRDLGRDRKKEAKRKVEGGRLTTPINEDHVSNNTIKSKGGTYSLLQ
jgi:hypothetical protein